MKKCVLESFRKFTEKHLWFPKFSKTPLLQDNDTSFTKTPLFRATLLKSDTADSVWKTSDEYSLSRNT